MRSLWLVGALLAPSFLAAQTPGYEAAPAPGECRGLGALVIQPLLDSIRLGGGEVELALLTFPPGWDSAGQGHRHGRVEIFYVLSGRLGHIVNDSMYPLDPGQIGVVRPGDRVRHRVLSPEPVRALTIWAPGGEMGGILGATRPAACPPAGTNPR